jgi:hypothetical protein
MEITSLPRLTSTGKKKSAIRQDTLEEKLTAALHKLLDKGEAVTGRTLADETGCKYSDCMAWLRTHREATRIVEMIPQIHNNTNCSSGITLAIATATTSNLTHKSIATRVKQLALAGYDMETAVYWVLVHRRTHLDPLTERKNVCD